jgi:hypothetical protein
LIDRSDGRLSTPENDRAAAKRIAPSLRIDKQPLSSDRIA